MFRTVLEDLGQNLVLVRSGTDALREILQREFAVILLDVNMPGMDGFETATLIRQHRRSAHTPIIFITSYADEMQTARGYSLGAVDYILSPVVPEILRSKVQVFVSLYLMQRQVRRQADARAAVMAAAGGSPRRRGERPALRLPRPCEPRAQRLAGDHGGDEPADRTAGAQPAPARRAAAGRSRARRGRGARRGRAARRMQDFNGRPDPKQRSTPPSGLRFALLRTASGERR